MDDPTILTTDKTDMAKKATKKASKKVKSSKTTKATDTPRFRIVSEFRHLLPDLTPEEYKALEDSLRSEGLREPLIVWKEKGILVDGHNRLTICKKYGIKYRIREKSFESKEAAKLWILDNQAGRRNMTTFQRIEAVLNLKDVIAEQAKKNQQAGGGAVRKKVYKPIRTDKMLGDRVGVSHVIIRKAESILEAYHKRKIDEKVIDALRKGKAKISSIYNLYCKDQSKKEKQQERGMMERSNSFFKSLKMQIARFFPQMEDRNHIYKQLSEWANEEKD